MDMNFHVLSMKSDNLGLVPALFNLSHPMAPATGALSTCSVRSIGTFFFFNISFSVELSAFSCRVPVLQRL